MSGTFLWYCLFFTVLKNENSYSVPVKKGINFFPFRFFFPLIQIDLQAAWTELTKKTYSVTIIEGKVPEVSPTTPEIAICYGKF